MDALHGYTAGLLALVAATPVSAQNATGLRFEVTVPSTLHAQPLTGRVFVFLS